MRPVLAIVPLALLLAWFGPSPSIDSLASAPLGLSDAQAPDHTPRASDPFAQAWAAIQRGDFLQASSDTPQRH